jgi:hypothetical protein
MGGVAPDRRHLPARVSLEMLPARGRVAVFEAPRDASSLADSRRDSCLRCREPGPETVCIVKSDTSRGHLRAKMQTRKTTLHPP